MASGQLNDNFHLSRNKLACWDCRFAHLERTSLLKMKSFSSHFVIGTREVLSYKLEQKKKLNKSGWVEVSFKRSDFFYYYFFLFLSLLSAVLIYDLMIGFTGLGHRGLDEN